MSTNCKINTLWLIFKIGYLKDLSVATYSNIYNIKDEKPTQNSTYCLIPFMLFKKPEKLIDGDKKQECDYIWSTTETRRGHQGASELLITLWICDLFIWTFTL